ncbi:MAG: tetratricopeptide repeat protein [Planctomycetes bacterium]|nr:tetratricopeptide repeat protein [Planctomycetota bacterium]
MMKKMLFSLCVSFCMTIFASADERPSVTVTNRDAVDIINLAGGFAKYISTLPSNPGINSLGEEYDALMTKGDSIIPFILKELFVLPAVSDFKQNKQPSAANKPPQELVLPAWAGIAALCNTPAGKASASSHGGMAVNEPDFWAGWWLENSGLFAGEYFASEEGKLLLRELKTLASDRLALQKYNAAYNNMLNRDEADAVKKFSDISQLYPDSKYADDAMFWKGYCMVDMQNYGEAIKVFQKLIELFPQSEYADDSYLKIGEAYEIHIHDYDKAIETYKQFAEKFPNTVNPASNSVLMGRALENKNDYYNALKNYKQAQQEMQTLNEQQQQLKSGNWNFWYAKTIEDRIRFIDENNDYDWMPLTKYNIAKDAYLKGEYADCEKSLKELLEKYADSKIADDAAFALVKVLEKQSKTEEAAKYRLQYQGRQTVQQQEQQQVRPVSPK